MVKKREATSYPHGADLLQREGASHREDSGSLKNAVSKEKGLWLEARHTGGSMESLEEWKPIPVLRYEI